MQVRELTNAERIRFHARGVLVERIADGSKIAGTNMEENYIITSVNDNPVETVEDLAAEIKGSRSKVRVDGFYGRLPGKTYPYTFEKE